MLKMHSFSKPLVNEMIIDVCLYFKSQICYFSVDLVGSGHDFVDAFLVFHVSFQILGEVDVLQDVVYFQVRQLLAKGGKEVSELGAGNESLSLAVESLEGLHEVGEGTGVFLLEQFLVQGNELFEFVGFLSHLLGAAVFGNDGVGGVAAKAAEEVA